MMMDDSDGSNYTYYYTVQQVRGTDMTMDDPDDLHYPYYSYTTQLVTGTDMTMDQRAHDLAAL